MLIRRVSLGKGHRSPSQARSVKVKSGKERVGLQGTAEKEGPPQAPLHGGVPVSRRKEGPLPGEERQREAPLW